jgi:hypothetical protein
VQAVRCSVCGLFVRPRYYGSLLEAVPGWHYPCVNEATLTAVEVEYGSTMTLCEGSQVPGRVFEMGDSSGDKE